MLCLYVCMSVRYGFTIEIYGFTHSLRPTRDAIACNENQGLGGQQSMPEQVQRYGRWLTTQQKAER